MVAVDRRVRPDRVGEDRRRRGASPTGSAREVVSCDALQVYRGLPILTNQPSRPTALVGIRGLDEEMSVGAYAGLAHDAIDELVGADRDGGRRAAARVSTCAPRSPISPCRRRRPPGVRERILAEVEQDPAAAHERLAGLDPRAAAAVHANDRRRLVRALELAEAGRIARARRRPALGERHPASDADRRARRSARRARAADRRAHRRDVRRRASSRRFARRSPQASRGRRRRRSGSTRSRRCPSPRRASGSSSARAATPPISGSGCAASPASSAWTAR